MELTSVARVTRELFRKAVESRLFRLRYKLDSIRARDNVFDIQPMWHPALSNLLFYIDKMVDCDATHTKAKNEDLLVQLVVNPAGELEMELTSMVT